MFGRNAGTFFRRLRLIHAEGVREGSKTGATGRERSGRRVAQKETFTESRPIPAPILLVFPDRRVTFGAYSIPSIGVCLYVQNEAETM